MGGRVSRVNCQVILATFSAYSAWRLGFGVGNSQFVGCRNWLLGHPRWHSLRNIVDVAAWPIVWGPNFTELLGKVLPSA